MARIHRGEGKEMQISCTMNEALELIKFAESQRFGWKATRLENEINESHIAFVELNFDEATFSKCAEWESEINQILTHK